MSNFQKTRKAGSGSNWRTAMVCAVGSASILLGVGLAYQSPAGADTTTTVPQTTTTTSTTVPTSGPPSEIDAGPLLSTTVLQNASVSASYADDNGNWTVSPQGYGVGTALAVPGGTATVTSPADGSFLRWTIRPSYLGCTGTDPTATGYQVANPCGGTIQLLIDGKPTTLATFSPIYSCPTQVTLPGQAVPSCPSTATGGFANGEYPTYVQLTQGTHTVALQVTLDQPQGLTVSAGQPCDAGSGCPSATLTFQEAALTLEILGAPGTGPPSATGEISSPFLFGPIGLGIATGAGVYTMRRRRRDSEALSLRDGLGITD
jgi:hypothetical protein